MNIAIDIGNTQIKLGVFVEAVLQEVLVLAKSDTQAWQKIAIKYPVQQVIVSSVADEATLLQSYFPNSNFVVFNHDTPIPIKNAYQTPHTLGLDRLAAAVGAASIHPDKSSMIIDAGSCITLDFVKHANEYIGGVISPGLQMRFNALYTFTEKLPLLYPDVNATMIIGDDTNTSILTGVQQGLLEEIKGTIIRYREFYGDFSIVLCGGDASFLERFLKNSIFAPQITQSPDLVLLGLNRILLHNDVH